MSHWIFKANPEKYRLQARLRDPNPAISWRVSRYRNEIRPGDTAFVWQTGKERGLCATLRIDSAPREIDELSREIPYCVDPDLSSLGWRVRATIQRRFPLIPAEEFRTTPGLELLSVFSGFHQATNFSVTPQEARIIESLIAKKT